MCGVKTLFSAFSKCISYQNIVLPRQSRSVVKTIPHQINSPNRTLNQLKPSCVRTSTNVHATRSPGDGVNKLSFQRVWNLLLHELEIANDKEDETAVAGKSSDDKEDEEKQEEREVEATGMMKCKKITGEEWLCKLKELSSYRALLG
ncbi:uncharacterized protein LOC110032073 [Phalaenopsis equestris]|uniref:uncharacterized protein LOC110032073 n=1 Tax=Phalaenopsis equestris TaxID=78828 RepID=UPI0009E5A5C1|nr:uncharacterized protein LOC110032073 [Phalaenopsis equestris]